MIVGSNVCGVQRVPDIKDIDKIEKMLEDLGQRELEMGEITEGDLLRMEQEHAVGRVPGGLEAPAPGAGAGAGFEGEETVSEGAGGEEDFAALLKDIQIGLEEEKELEGLMAAEEGEAPAEAPVEKVPGPQEEARAPEVEEPSLASVIEYIPEEAETTGEAPEVTETEAELPEEKPGVGLPGAEPSAAVEVEAESAVAQEGEIDLDLPEDFDLEDVAYEEKPSGGFIYSGEEEAAHPEGGAIPGEPGPPEAGAEEEAEEAAAEMEVPEIPEEPAVPEEVGEAGGLEEIQIPDLESLGLLYEEAGREEESLEEAPGQVMEMPPEEERAEKKAEAEAEKEGGIEALGSEELAGISGKEPVEAGPRATEEEFEFPEFELPELEKGEKAAAEEEAGIEIEEEIPEMPELGGEEAAPPSEEFPEEELLPGEPPAQELPPEELPEEAPMELADEDIVAIKAKLKQMSPQLASFVRDSILAGTLPVAIVNEMLRLLLEDAPEQEITSFVEQATGRQPAVRKPVPGIITVERKPGVLENIYQSLGPLVRVAGLFIIIMTILSIIFMLFIYKPMRARQYYSEGITYIKNAQYELAEQSFTRAREIYESVKKYDDFGWEYMISGNYDAARRKFEFGIKLDEGMRNLGIRLHMALLHNILGEYAEADRLYSEVLEKSPRTYEYIRLKGMNLIDWGKAEQPDKLDEAYNLFNTAFDEKPKLSDPLFKMLSISIFQEKAEDISALYEYITNRFPQDVDAAVYTDLASYFITHEQFEKVRDLLLRVLDRAPGYPEAHMAFAKYYKAIKNAQMQEEFLKSAIIYENDRPLKYPWDKRNRALLSSAYNDLGEIYAGMETPGMAAESIRYFEKAIDQNRRNMKAYFNLAQVYFYKAKNYRLATQYYEAAEAGGFQNYDLDYNLGLLYFYEHSFTKALNRWSRLSEVFPDNPNIEFAMGCAMLHLGTYSAAQGEFMLLSEVYDGLVKKLGEIKPWRAYHKRILLESAAVLNNLGVAYQKLAEETGNEEYQKESLLVLYKAGELADITGTERGKIQYNINYILHPDVIRSSMAVDDSLSNNYRFIAQ